VGEIVGDLVVGGATLLAHSAAEAVVKRVKKAAAKSAPVKAVKRAAKKAKKSAAGAKVAKTKKAKKASKKPGLKKSVGIYNEAPGSDGNGGNVATDGNVAMATSDDSEPVTRAMIAAGLSQLPPMDETFAHLVETVEAFTGRCGKWHGRGNTRYGRRKQGRARHRARTVDRGDTTFAARSGLIAIAKNKKSTTWLGATSAGCAVLLSACMPGRDHGVRHGPRIAIPCHCHRAIGCHNATMANGTVIHGGSFADRRLSVFVIEGAPPRFYS
jgi:hypothetical protein